MMYAAACCREVNPINSVLQLAGFAKRTNSSEQIGPSKLEAKIVWLECNDQTLLFISLDTLYFSKKISDAVNGFCLNEYGIEPSNIIYSATHTHAAPNTGLPFFGSIDLEYIGHIISEIKSGLKECRIKQKCVRLAVKEFPLGNKVIGRRRIGRDIKSLFFKKAMLMLPNDDQKIDAFIRTAEFSLLDGTRVVTLINFSCHPVFSNNSTISSDFPGQISSVISNKNDGISIYLQGFCGDMRPNYTMSKVSLTSITNSLRLLFNKKVFRSLNSNDFYDFCSDIVDRIIRSKAIDGGRYQNCELTTYSHDFKVKSQSGKVEKRITVKLIFLANVLFISIPAEVNSRYIVELKKKFPDYLIFPLGFGEGMIGYLPFHSEIKEGGYEVNSSTNYGWDGPLSVNSLLCFYSDLTKEIEKYIRTSN